METPIYPYELMDIDIPAVWKISGMVDPIALQRAEPADAIDLIVSSVVYHVLYPR